jgi:cytochrome c-type biogenesis protein CcmH/NrfG
MKKAQDAEGAARSNPRDAKLRIAFAAALVKLGDAQLADTSVPLATRMDNANQCYTKAGHIDGKNVAAKAGLGKVKKLQAKGGPAN